MDLADVHSRAAAWSNARDKKGGEGFTAFPFLSGRIAGTSLRKPACDRLSRAGKKLLTTHWETRIQGFTLGVGLHAAGGRMLGTRILFD